MGRVEGYNFEKGGHERAHGEGGISVKISRQGGRKQLGCLREWSRQREEPLEGLRENELPCSRTVRHLHCSVSG